MQSLAELLSNVNVADIGDGATGIPEGSIDLIVTDPPYLQDDLYLYGTLARVASRVLKPKGFLMAYCGVVHKAQVLPLLCAHMSYFYDLVLVNTGGGVLVRNRSIWSDHKSVLVFRQRGSVATRPNSDVFGSIIHGSGPDKRYHVWGQDVESCIELIRAFSVENDLVYDPFCGGGTTAAACMLSGRRFIVSDLDPSAVVVTRARVQQVYHKQTEVFA